MVPIRVILHPTDFSEPSAYAFQLACMLARDQGARLVITHVALPPEMVSRGQGAAEGQLTDYYRDLQNKLHQLRPPEGVPVEYRLDEGDPAQAILRAAQETRCHLIVMGTQGRTGLELSLLGSVAEQVVRSAPCPALAVKSPLPGAPPVAESRPGDTVGAG
jgi:nucleotide-binding universal stress UspA family protein